MEEQNKEPEGDTTRRQELNRVIEKIETCRKNKTENN